MFKHRVLVSVVFLALAILSGCSGTGKSTPLTQTAVVDYEKEQTDYKAAALRYLSLAEESQDLLQSQEYMLLACDMLVQAEAPEQAMALLANIEQEGVAQSLKPRWHIIQARLKLRQQKPIDALKTLRHIWAPSELPGPLHQDYYRLRATAYLRMGNALESAKARMALSPLLTDPETRQANSYTIWETLSQLTPQALKIFKRQPVSHIFDGWVELVFLSKTYHANPEQLIQALQQWDYEYQDHPAREIIPGFETLHEPITLPNRIALLLPLEGPYAATAQAIREGFLAGFYQSQRYHRPNIMVINSYPDPIRAYQEAIESGVDFIVGPLTKEEVLQFAPFASMDVPMLALNQLNEMANHSPEHFYQFGLPPEAEAIAVAKKLWDDGFRYPLVITPKTDWGNRMHQAFTEHWERFGFPMIGKMEYTVRGDYAKDMRQALAIDDSTQRARTLSSVLGLKLDFEPRRRQDPDVIFLIGPPDIARQMKPLLSFYYASQLPVYASSHIFSGHSNPDLDQDLNGVTFCDMPWVLDDSTDLSRLKQRIAKQWPNSYENYPRLFALGIDAYKLTTQLQHLERFPALGTSGMTGMLRLNQHHQIQRQLIWAKMKNGVPTLVLEAKKAS